MDEDRERLGEFYRNAGYIDFELLDVKYLTRTSVAWTVYFQIHEGPQYKVGAIHFKGFTLFTTNEVSKRLR
jgi:outer membrane protein assembly factor BamA